MCACVIGIYCIQPSRVYAAIYGIRLPDNTATDIFSQQFTLELIEYPAEKHAIYLETLIDDEKYYTIRTLQRESGISYRLILNETISPDLQLVAVNNGKDYPLSPESGAGSARRSYIISEEFIRFKIAPITTQLSVLEAKLASALFDEGNFSIELPRTALHKPISIQLSRIPDLIPNGELVQLTPTYQFDIVDRDVPSLADTPVTISLAYAAENSMNKTLYYYDSNKESWIQLPSYNDIGKKIITSKVPFTFARVAVFGTPAAEDGIASWYAYKRCLCAASRKYPKGSLVKVTRLLTNKSIVVRINDYGPEAYTKRLIDLDKEAFRQLGSLRSGLIYVKVEPYDNL